MSDPVRDALAAFIDERIAVAMSKLARPANDGYLTPEDAAELARVTPETIRRWVRAKRLTRVGDARRVLVRRDDLERLIVGSRDTASLADRVKKKLAR